MDRIVSYGSLFAGIGGFDLAFDRAGMHCAWQVEIDDKCQQVQRRHWPNVARYGDVRNVGKHNLEPVGVIVGGFPCQDLSVAGRRAGLAGKRSGLWNEFHRVIAELHPAWVVIENVPGLLSSNEGRDMGTILWSLGELGYWWAYRSLDAQYDGLAQRRKRVFIVGCLGSRAGATKVLFESESLPGDPPPSRETETKVASLLASGAGTSRQAGTVGVNDCKSDAQYVVYCLQTSNTKANANKKWWKEQAYPLQTSDIPAVAIVNALSSHHQHLDPSQETFVCNTFNGYTGGADDNDAQGRHLIPMAFQSKASARNSMNPSSVTPSLDVGKSDGMAALTRYGVRRLTPIEAERLQGFHDGWTAWGVDGGGNRVEMSDSARYRMLGNAVAVPVVEWIGRRIMRTEQQIAKPTEKELAAFTYSVYDFISRHMCGKSLDEMLDGIKPAHMGTLPREDLVVREVETD